MMINEIGRIDAIILDMNDAGNILFSASTLLNRDYIKEATNLNSDDIEFFAHHIEETLFRCVTNEEHIQNAQECYLSRLEENNVSRTLSDDDIAKLVKLVINEIKYYVITQEKDELIKDPLDSEEKTSYKLLLENAISIAQPDAEVNSEFLDTAASDEVSVLTAFRSWLEDEDQPGTIEMLKSN